MTKNFCFTANNFGEIDDPSLKASFAAPEITYWIKGNEGKGAGKTPHWQGFVQTAEPCRHTAINKLLPGADLKSKARKKYRWQTWHWENKHRKSTCDQARDYCKKEGDWIEGGVFVGGHQGKRSDLVKVSDLIQEGADKATIFKECPEAFLKYRSNIVQTIGDLQEASALQRGTLEVIVLWGPTGTGKTHMALHADKDKKVYLHHAEVMKKGWWPGYRGEPILILDDWHPGCCSISTMLMLLDKYKCALSVKGAHSWAAWTTVWITTNLQWPEEIYTGARPVHREALFRRITQVHHITKGYRERTPILWDQFGLGEEREEKTPMDIEEGVAICTSDFCIHGLDSAKCSAAKHADDPPLRKPILIKQNGFIFMAGEE